MTFHFVIYKEIDSIGSLLFKLFILIQIHLNAISWNWRKLYTYQAIAIILLNNNKQEDSDFYYNNPQFFALVSYQLTCVDRGEVIFHLLSFITLRRKNRVSIEPGKCVRKCRWHLQDYWLSYTWRGITLNFHSYKHIMLS